MPGALYCVFSMIVLTLGEMLTSPLGPAWTARRSGPANRGKYLSLYVTSFSFAVLIAPVSGMWLYDINPHLVWYVSLIIGGLVFFGLMMLADREHSASEVEQENGL